MPDHEEPRGDADIFRREALEHHARPAKEGEVLRIVELENGRRFREESTTLSLRRWSHERTVDPGPDGQGCRITDRLNWEPRALTPDALVRRVVAALFTHRHRRLRLMYATGSA